mmetsp:Transcript_14263/g.39219  ORF Transcript_14263/g.39219 Transcript_14263/m.39219 type:complete len:209 (+) Transcript_14263:281-907(+)
MVCSSSAIFAVRSACLSVVFAVVISFSWISSLHQSFFLTSSSCCFFSMTTMSSMAALTFVKASSFALEASSANSGAPVAAAALIKTAVAWLRRSCMVVEEMVCKNELTVLSKFEKASSSFKILMVSSTATISSSRSLTRWSNSVSLAAHFSFRLARKVLSRSSWACVSSSSWKACACFSLSSAMFWSSSACRVLPDTISASLAALREA